MLKRDQLTLMAMTNIQKPAFFVDDSQKKSCNNPRYDWPEFANIFKYSRERKKKQMKKSSLTLSDGWLCWAPLLHLVVGFFAQSRRVSFEAARKLPLRQVVNVKTASDCIKMFLHAHVTSIEWNILKSLFKLLTSHTSKNGHVFSSTEMNDDDF